VGAYIRPLREINPDVGVILASGYSAEGEARKIINRGCWASSKAFQAAGILKENTRSTGQSRQESHYLKRDTAMRSERIVR